MKAETLPECLDVVAGTTPDGYLAFMGESTRLTFADLADSSTATARALVARGVVPGDVVGILCPTGPEFPRAFFGALRAGAAACPLPLPVGVRDLDAYVARLGRIAAAAGMRHVVCPDQLDLPLDVTVLRAHSLVDAGAALPTVSPDDKAVVQFTSGSTTDPKGVVLTHANVLAGLDAIVDGIGLGPSDSAGFWLPLFHDMGLFGTLAGLLTGIPVHLWSPASFVKRPGRWLREFAATRSSITAMPNFGYDYLVDAVPPEEAAGLDLSAWRVAFNGAEPIQQPSIDAFQERFGPAGFRPETMLPGYGLAEATLVVALPPLGRSPVFAVVDREALADGRVVATEHGRAVAGIGRAVLGMRLRIAGSSEVGEIQVSGTPVTSGYLGLPAEQQPFTEDGWLRTGDLGFVAGDELYVTGRIKDMLIVRGENVYPQDVEAAVQDVAGVYKRRVVAVPDADDSLLVVVESGLPDARLEDVAAAVRARVTTALGLPSPAVLVVAPSMLPRTSSGKFRRGATRALASTHTARISR